ncbi:neural cell adhesion molecule 1-like [Orbicella faveolata]|uniref:neural cell adhesion molecule 1-like n=1 Tax=Orbicella faveolata TaxID=48498 RepID=UPI0009E28784|nr:neural cell adhesion molecule 1-like [Orbicella faveolata]
MIKYSRDVGVVNYKDGSVGMATNGTPAFTLINLQQHDDKAEFCCKVGTKSTGASSGNLHKHCVTLKLLVRPNIMAISGNQTLNESNDVILSCNAKGTPPPNVTWSISGDQDKNFDPGSLLPLRNISRAQDGLYWGTAENGAGKSVASVRITVQCK